MVNFGRNIRNLLWIFLSDVIWDRVFWFNQGLAHLVTVKAKIFACKNTTNKLHSNTRRQGPSPTQGRDILLNSPCDWDPTLSCKIVFVGTPCFVIFNHKTPAFRLGADIVLGFGTTLDILWRTGLSLKSFPSILQDTPGLDSTRKSYLKHKDLFDPFAKTYSWKPKTKAQGFLFEWDEQGEASLPHPAKTRFRV